AVSRRWWRTAAPACWSTWTTTSRRTSHAPSIPSSATRWPRRAWARPAGSARQGNSAGTRWPAARFACTRKSSNRGREENRERHITTTWRMSSLLGNYITPVPAQQRLGPRWYLGSADAILQSLNLIYDERPEYVAVFGADHVYRMDPRQMLAQHIDSGAGVTV